MVRGAGRETRVGSEWYYVPIVSRSENEDHTLMKIMWLVTNVTAVRSPDSAERAIVGVVLAWRFFGQFRPYVWAESHFVV